MHRTALLKAAFMRRRQPKALLLRYLQDPIYLAAHQLRAARWSVQPASASALSAEQSDLVAHALAGLAEQAGLFQAYWPGAQRGMR